jgi:hypothetical protein
MGHCEFLPPIGLRHDAFGIVLESLAVLIILNEHHGVALANKFNSRMVINYLLADVLFFLENPVIGRDAKQTKNLKFNVPTNNTLKFIFLIKKPDI